MYNDFIIHYTTLKFDKICSLEIKKKYFHVANPNLIIMQKIL
jgi:hypothetical protein